MYTTDKKSMYNLVIRCIAFTMVLLLNVANTDAQMSMSNYSTQPEGNGNVQVYEQKAKERGYSDQQIQEYKKRYASQQKNTSAPATYFSDYTKPVTQEDSLASFSDSGSAKQLVKRDSLALDSTINLKMPDSLTTDSLPFFGYALFETTPDAFRPNAVGLVDPGYLVGPGDVLRLSVWGEVEFQYELKVTREGKVFLPVAGQIHVVGIPFEELQKKVKNVLSRHYSGLAAEPPKSFLDLSVAQMRPVRVFIMGEVKAPGGYTVATSSTAFNAFYSIGGPLVSGSLRDIKIVRNQKEMASLDMYQYLTTGKCSTDVRLQNDDVIFVPRRGKTVTVKGAAFRPAVYELKETENLLALLSFCGGVNAKSNVAHALVKRVKPFSARVPDLAALEVISIDLQKHLTGKTEFVLADNDTLEIVALSDDRKNFVTLSGAVHYPGIYQCDNLTLHKLIFTFGKPLEAKAYFRRADLVRLNDDMVTMTTIPVDLDALVKNPAAHDKALKPFDQIIIYEKEVEKPVDLLVAIEGEVRNPGAYIMSTNLTVADAILRAGGYTRLAFRGAVDVYRIKLHGSSDTLIEVYKVKLPDSLTFANEAERVFPLQDRDKIVVRPDPDYIVDNYVMVNGLVKFRGTYAIKQRGERLSDVVERAGGLLPDAFLEGATVYRGGKRLVVNFKGALSGKLSKENILLQKNDSIFIPTSPNTVLITGNVNNPGLFSFVSGSKVRTYINRAGGFADSTSFILLTFPGGETFKIGKSSFKNPLVLEGSEIIVMKKPARDRTVEKQGPTITEVVRDTLAILASAVTVIGLAIQLSN